ncbi:MAG: aldehyde ferredoxin oxidoreductase family protein [Candidatus Bathyarchaeia archaeon]
MLKRKIAYIDLTAKKIATKEIPVEMRKLYLGGRGINTYLRYNLIKPKIDALGPENVLLVGAGLLGGLPCLGSSRCDIAAKSPLTGAVGSTNMGGFFAAEMRFAGFDHLAIMGKAEKPVYVWINDGQIEIKDASHIWGKDTVETQEIIRKDHGDDEIKCMVIGVAGEKLVKFANVMTGIKNSGGRTGMGAVMGSKNLKAIAVRGTGDLEVAHPTELLEYCRQLNEKVLSTKWAQAEKRWGTLIIFNNTNTTGLIRVKNFQLNKLEDSEDLEAENIERYSIGVAGCFGCSVHCRHRYVLRDSPFGPIYDEGPEYTTQGAFGTEVYCKRMETLLIANHLVDRYGLDTLDAGSMIAWAIELYEKGIIDDKVTGGIKLEWGNEQLVYELIRMIAYREGFGDILAEGPLGAIAKFGPESAYYCIHVKGMSNLQSDERPTPSFALGIATSTRGADHLRSRPAYDLYGLPEEALEKLLGGGPVSSDYTSYVGKSRMVWHQELLYSVCDSLGLCKFQTVFLGFNMPKWEEYSRLLYLATGLEFTKEQLMLIGERIYTLERMFNMREGFTRKDDTLPERYFKEPTPVGLPIARGKKIDREKFEQMLDEYYELHGWDKNGVPTEETLKKLGLDKEPSHML